jgi:hypothetical protein
LLITFWLVVIFTWAPDEQGVLKVLDLKDQTNESFFCIFSGYSNRSTTTTTAAATIDKYVVLQQYPGGNAAFSEWQQWPTTKSETG